jgi:hypothetical protein
MRAGHYLTISLFMLGSCGQSSEAAPPKPKPKSEAAGSAPFDLAGVAVGDSLASAMAALRQRGFSIEMHTGTWSFDDWVENSRAKSIGRSTYIPANAPKGFYARKGPELITAELRASSEGMVIESVTYTAPSNGRPPEQLIREVKARYSNGLQASRGAYRICAISDDGCNQRQPEENYVQFTPTDPFRILLFPGAAQERKWRTDFDAALRKRLGPPPSSF